MTLTTLLDVDPLDPFDGDQSFNFFNYSAGTLTSVTVAFYYVDASLVRWSFFDSAIDTDPTGRPVSEVIDSSPRHYCLFRSLPRSPCLASAWLR